METEWERAPYRSLSLEEANQALEPSGYRCVRLDLITEGRANTNFRVHLSGGGDALLRLSQREANLSGPVELAVGPRLRSLGVPIPEVLWHSSDGSLSLHRWVEGRSLERLIAQGDWPQALAAARSVGEGLGRIHSWESATAGFIDASAAVPHPWRSLFEGYFDYIRILCDNPTVEDRAGPRIPARVRAVVDQKEAWLRPHFERASLTHGDYKASNLLIADGKLVAVVDWEFAHMGSLYLDLGILLRHDRGWPSEFTQEVEAGLGDAMLALPPDWRQIALATDLLSLLDFLSRPQCGPLMRSSAIQLLNHSLEELESSGGLS